MPQDIGGWDRNTRLTLGLVLTGLAPGVYGPAGPSSGLPWGWLGAIPLLTAVFGSCPLHALFGLHGIPALRAAGVVAGSMGPATLQVGIRARRP